MTVRNNAVGSNALAKITSLYIPKKVLSYRPFLKKVAFSFN